MSVEIPSASTAVGATARPEPKTERGRYLDLSLLGLPELALCVAGPALLVTLFLVPWFSTTGYATVHHHRGLVTGWQTYTFLRYFLLWCGVGAFILPWMVARRHQVDWRRGELTALHGLTGAVVLFWNGLGFRPGDPPGDVHIQVGYIIALLLMIVYVLAGAFSADHHTPIPRKPPGI